MPKILVFDKCIVDDSKAVSEYEPEELFQHEGSSFSEYIDAVNAGNLDDEHFNIEDVDTSVFIIDDGGELFRLKNGTYINVCWRGSYCRVWPEDDQEMIDIYNEKLGKTNTIEEDLVWTPISVENEINLAIQEQGGWFDASDFTKEDRKKVAELIVAQSDNPWTSSDIRNFVLDICKEDGNWKYVLGEYDINFDESLKEGKNSEGNYVIKAIWGSDDGDEHIRIKGNDLRDCLIKLFEKVTGDDKEEIYEVTNGLESPEAIISSIEEYAADVGEGFNYLEDITAHKLYFDYYNEEEYEDESLKEEVEEPKLETFEDKMDFLAKDEQEAIDGYDKVIAMLNPEEDGFVIEQLTKIKVEEEAHKKYLEKVKTNRELEYTEPLEEPKKDESLKEAEEETTSEEPSKGEKTEPKIISDGLGQRRADKLAAMLNEENPDGVNGPFAEEPATSEDATVEISSQAGYEKTKFNDDGSIDVEYHWAEGFWNEETDELEDLDGEETFETLEEWISHAEQNTFFLNIDLGELENVK